MTKRILLLCIMYTLSACSMQAERVIPENWRSISFVDGADIALPLTGSVKKRNDCLLVQSQEWTRGMTNAEDDSYFLLHFCPMTEYKKGEDYIRQMCMPIGEDSRGYLIDFSINGGSARIWGVKPACWDDTVFVIEIAGKVYRGYLSGDETISGQKMAAEAVKTIRLVQ